MADHHYGKQYFAYRSFWPEFQTVADFRDAGVDSICVFPANTVNSLGEPYCKYPPNWLWFDRYDFSVVDRVFSDMLQVNPGAEILCMIDLNSPQWLSRQLSLYHDAGDSFTQLSQTVCHHHWKQATMNYLRNFLAHCEKHHAGIIRAYILACGHTDEWLDHSAGAAGQAKAAAYHDWREQQQLPQQSIPSQEQLNATEFDGLIRDPAAAKNVMDYWSFTNQIIGKTIIEFAEETRKIIRPEVEIGTFYGYVIDRIGPISSGHADYRRLLQSSSIDFLISPGTYRDREIGGGSGFLTVSGSERLAGKRHMHECDQRTHTYNRNLSENVKLEFPCWPDTASDIAGMKREFALSLTSGSSLWWFDMWGGFYKERELLDNLAKMKNIWDQMSGCERFSVAETAMIIDPDSLYYFSQSSPRQADFALNTRKQLNRMGAPYESFSFDDLPHIPDLQRYRFLIFPAQIEITPEKAEILRRFVLRDQRTVLWLYAPGISNGQVLDPEFVRQWAGAPYGSQSLTVSRMDDWTSAYLHDPTRLSPQILADLADHAGVHLHTLPGCAVYADSSLISVHTATGGGQHISLPRKYSLIRELFSGNIVARDSDSFTWTFSAPDTALFQLQP